MEFPRATYFLDISSVTKAFVRIPDVSISATGMTDSGAVELTFDGPTHRHGRRGRLHTRPEATITVPDDPTALAEAVSVLGSSIKEFTPSARGRRSGGTRPESASVTNSTSRVRSSLPTPASRWSCDPRMPTCTGSPRSRTTSALGSSLGMRRRSDSTPATSSPCRPKVSRSKSASRSYSGRGSSSTRWRGRRGTSNPTDTSTNRWVRSFRFTRRNWPICR